MIAFVTGGAGFIGSHLCDKLIAKGCEVIAIDNFSKGSPQNIKHLRESPHFKFIEADINNIDQYSHSLDKVTHIFHLAGYADIVPSIENPYEYYENNVTATVKLLEVARASKKVEKFCYAASSSCYGIPDQYPTTEDAPIRPQYPYALTKYMAEEAILHWAKVYKIPTMSLRLFNVYGPRAKSKNAYGAVLGTFLAQAAQNKNLTIVGDGKQKRDFIYVSDVVEAFYLAALSKVTNEVINIGAGNPREINYLASLISGDVTYIEKRPGEPDQTYADIAKAKKILNWEPQVSLEEGLQKMKAASENWKESKAWSPEEIKETTKAWFDALKD